MNTIGERLKYLRRSRNVKQKELSDKTNVPRSTISKLENNNIKPAYDAVVAIANFFNVSTDWLATGSDNVNYDKAVPPNSSCLVAEKQFVYNLIETLDDESLRHVTEFIKFELHSKECKNK